MIKNIIIDIDGTLANTSEDIIKSLNNSLKKFNFKKKINFEDFKKIANLGSASMIKKIIKSNNYFFIDKVNKYFLKEYEKNICSKSKLKINVIHFLNFSKKEKINLFISTNKSEKIAKILLKKLNIERYFKFIAGRDTFPFRKPNPNHLLFMKTKYSFKKKQTLYVGDTEVDAEIAKKFNLKFVLFKNGYTTRNHLSIPYDHLISNIKQLNNICNGYK